MTFNICFCCVTFGVGGIKATAVDDAVWREVDVHGVSCRVERTWRLPTANSGQHRGQTVITWEHEHKEADSEMFKNNKLTYNSTMVQCLKLDQHLQPDLVLKE